VIALCLPRGRGLAFSQYTNKSIPFPDLDDLTVEVWDKIIDVNLTGPCMAVARQIAMAR
jgi:hypothetical protein